jgi:mRNA interferase MazF
MMRGEIWWADFGVPFGSEAGFRRPVLIVQDDTFNESRIRTIVVLELFGNFSFRTTSAKNCNFAAERREIA